MKIAYVCADAGIPVFGRKGCSVHVQEVVRAMGEVNASVDLYAARLGGEADQRQLPVNVYKLGRVRHDDQGMREQAAIAVNDRLPDLLDNNGPYGMVYERYSLWSYAALEWAKRTGVPSVLEVNAPLIEEQSRYRSLVDRAMAEKVRRRAFDAADIVVAVSETLAQHIEQCGVERHRIHVAPNGIDPRRFPEFQPASKPSAENVFTVGFLGTLKPWHGLSFLVDAFAILHRQNPQARLLIVGDGPERDNVVSQLNAYEIEKSAVMTGAVDHADVPGLLASMDVGVAPYPPGDSYFSPMKVMEYMAAGLAVVASRVGQIPDIVTSETGIIYPPGDIQALANALEHLRANPEQRTAMGRSGRDRVVCHHTWVAYVRRVMEMTGGATACASAALRSPG